ncbi:MAG: DUF1997 domain-containing protein [Geminocystis sp.]|nr:DUF1997 domain-containing protein [Geminocystis sp.]HIK36442.1 DUF1997 domain-containing protein [Geminocystis sp. M7585_C2015_104]MCS7149006.1 DUF1997 domain-containing protein [Geminocystis sp.]MCX8077354.1 DUF1997 domain-containing protein [Geminocystis sp.]MDW8114823.1 DUF1997 domain-containing protein [Geminocystis sp.]
MQIIFEAKESVNIEVKPQEIPICHYLRQPQRLVKAIADKKLMKPLGDDCYRIQMQPLGFLDLYYFQPTAVLRVWATPEGHVYLKSVSCELRGLEYLNRRFSLQLEGQLVPQEKEGRVYLRGEANLKVTVDLPPPLWLTPKPLLLSTGNGLLRGVLGRIKNRLMSQLVQDYYDFVKSEQEKCFSSPSLLPANPL